MQKIEDVLSKKAVGKDVALRGWIYRKREQKDLIFLILRDSTGIIQCVVKREEKPWKEARKATIESSIKVKGRVRTDPRAPRGYELALKDLKIIGLAEKFPIARDTSKSFLLDVRHLWLRSRKMTHVLKVRARVLEYLREFFEKEGYLEVQAPSFITAACEGGATLFELDYFGKRAYLTQSAQLYLEAIIFGLEKVYTIAPSFRAERSKTRRHLTEFWHVEAEAAWVDHKEMMKFEERMISFLCQRVAKQMKEELELLGSDPKELLKIKPPFPRISYTQAIELLRKKGFPIGWGDELGADEEKEITSRFKKPVFVHRYPAKIKAFYHMPDPKDPKVVLCHDLLAPQVGEIIGGGQRIHDLRALLKKIEEFKLDPRDYAWYVDLRRYGSVPHSGFGLGLDRFVTWICKLPHIVDSIPFPRTLTRVYP